MQIWATIIRYYLGSIADGADRRNLRKLHFFNQQNFCYKSKSNVINLSKSFFPKFLWNHGFEKKKEIRLCLLIHVIMCWIMICFFVRMFNFDESTFYINLTFYKEKLVSCFQWTNFYFSMNLWQKLFATDSFLYKLIKKYYGWTT